MILGYDIGGTKCAVSLARVHLQIEILERVVFPTRPFPVIQSVLIQAGKDLLRRHQVALCDLRGIGISCAGPLDSRRGTLLSPPNLPGWDNIPIVKIIQREFGAPVFLQNDANACALAEWKLGAGQGCDDMIFLTMGTGFGAGVISGGRLLRGVNDLAGEIGHVRLSEDGPLGYGKSGSVEGFCSGGGIARLAQSYTAQRIRSGHPPAWSAKGEQKEITAQLIASYAEQGDADAIEIFTQTGQRLGQTLSILIDLLNPERIVIGSIFVRCEHLLRPAMEDVVQRETLECSAKSCSILPAKTGEQIGDLAGILVACHALGIEISSSVPPIRSDIQPHLDRLLDRYPPLKPMRSSLKLAFCLLRDSLRAGGKLLIGGNGGSAADADHIVGELMKGFLLSRPVSRPGFPSGLQGALPAIALTQHTALSTAFGNDADPALTFAQQTLGLGRPGDVFLGISTSGNSQNIVLAAQTARALGMRVIALTGSLGGDLAAYSDVVLAAPAQTTPDVQEYHLPIYHTLCAMLEAEFFAS